MQASTGGMQLHNSPYYLVGTEYTKVGNWLLPVNSALLAYIVLNQQPNKQPACMFCHIS